MPFPIEEVIKRRVIEHWLSGEARDKIALDLQIGAGTVSSIVSDFKKDLQSSDFDSIRQLSIEIRKQGLNWSDLASHFRLYNYFVKSGAAEDEIETFITNISSNNIPPERVIELVYQLFNISEAESIPLDQVPSYIERKLEEKRKIDEEIKQADATLQSKNVTLEAIDEHIKLNEELNKHDLSTHDYSRHWQTFESSVKC